MVVEGEQMHRRDGGRPCSSEERRGEQQQGLDAGLGVAREVGEAEGLPPDVALDDAGMPAPALELIT